jgi:hypothetical protein
MDPLDKGTDPDQYQNVMEPQHYCKLPSSNNLLLRFETSFVQKKSNAAAQLRLGR